MRVTRRHLLQTATAACIALATTLAILRLTRPPLPPPSDDNIDSKLETLIPLMAFDHMHLDEELRFLSQKTGLEFIVDWDGLRSAGALILRGVPIRLENARAWEILNHILREAEQVKLLAWWPVGSKIHIGLASSAPPDQQPILRIYDVHDLLEEAIQTHLHAQQRNPVKGRVSLPAPTVAELELQTLIAEEVRLPQYDLAGRPFTSRSAPLRSPLASRAALRGPYIKIWSGRLLVWMPRAGQRRVVELLEILRQHPV